MSGISDGSDAGLDTDDTNAATRAPPNRLSWNSSGWMSRGRRRMSLVLDPAVHCVPQAFQAYRWIAADVSTFAACRRFFEHGHVFRAARRRPREGRPSGLPALVQPQALIMSDIAL